MAQIIWAIYCAAAFAYTMYSAITECGLDAYLTRLELDIIGTAEEVLTGLLTFGVLLAPLWAITRVLGKLAPPLVWAPAKVPNPDAGLSKPGLMEQLNRPVESVSWKMILVVTAIPILVGTVLFPIMYASEQRDRQAKVYPIDLTSGIADLPKGTRFVVVTGMMEQSYTLTFKHTFNTSTVSHELFAPITGSGWTPAEPIRYFVRHVSYEDGRGKTQWPDAFRKRGVAQFSGKISRSLPGFVESEYRSKGLKIAPSYSVVEWNNLPGPPSSSPSGETELVSGLCLLVAVFLFSMMIMVRFMVARMRRKQQAAG